MEQTKTTFRPYEPSDLASIVACESELQDHIAKLDPLNRERPKTAFDSKAYMDIILRQVKENDGMIFVAESAGSIVGFIAGCLNQDSEAERVECYPSKDGKVLELIVLPEHRGQKIGFELMIRMEKFFKEKACTAVIVDCFAPNQSAYQFYKSLGYEDRLISLLKML